MEEVLNDEEFEVCDGAIVVSAPEISQFLRRPYRVPRLRITTVLRARGMP